MNELDFISQSLLRIEEKLDTELKDHETRISTMEGGVRMLRFVVGVIIGIVSVVVGVVAL
jgi:hypothetical protein